MRKLRLMVFSFLFSTLFVVSAVAQTQPAAAAAPKIGLIDIYAFGAEKGITKYITAMKTLDGEFTPIKNNLQSAVTKIQALEKEITTLREQASKPGSPIPISSINTKIEELENLKRKTKFDQDDANAKYQTRYDAIVGPIWIDIRKAIQEFAKQRGYAVILDGAKLEEAGVLLGFDERVNITTEFIQFYNTRPAGTTTTTK